MLDDLDESTIAFRRSSSASSSIQVLEVLPGSDVVKPMKFKFWKLNRKVISVQG